MFTESAHLYDAIYSAFKNYETEAQQIATLIQSQHPQARAMLDVGCGTGEHVKHLRGQGFEADGLDLDASLLQVARQKVPTAQFFEADMSNFALGRRFDVVMCLFSSIGYLQSLARVTAALRCFRDHAANDGVVIVEPWFAPGVLREGPGPAKQAEVDGLHVERTSHMRVDGRISTLTFHYRMEDAAGVRVAQEVHTLGLFTPTEMMDCFTAAGLAANYDPAGLTGRGLYVARVAAP